MPIRNEDKFFIQEIVDFLFEIVGSTKNICKIVNRTRRCPKVLIIRILLFYRWWDTLVNWERVKEASFAYFVLVVHGLQLTQFYLFASWHFKIAFFNQLLNLSFRKSKALPKLWILKSAFRQMIQVRKNVGIGYTGNTCNETCADILLVIF